MKQDPIKVLRKKIESGCSSRILHVLSGGSMLETFRRHGMSEESSVLAPFQEAMCWGKTAGRPFSDDFIRTRAEVFRCTMQEYQKTVIRPLIPFLSSNFERVVLWFGDDMFCQMNLITAAAYLEQRGYTGELLVCVAEERPDCRLDGPLKVSPDGYLDLYRTVLCGHHMLDGQLLPVTRQAVRRYLNYLGPDSEILAYIRQNLNREHLLEELLARFPEYGLGDSQYQALIDNEAVYGG